MDAGTQLMAFPIPKDPAAGPVGAEVVDRDLHVMHNFLTRRLRPRWKAVVLTASYEGVSCVAAAAGGPGSGGTCGAGHRLQENPKGSTRAPAR